MRRTSSAGGGYFIPLGGLLPNAPTQVPTQAVERTHWEKATILRALHHSGKLRDGLSRHYYDVVMLARAGVTDKAIETGRLWCPGANQFYP